MVFKAKRYGKVVLSMVKKRRLDIIILIVLIVIAIGSWIAVTVLFDVNGDY